MSVTLILFSIIDILGAIPVIIEIRKKSGVVIESGKTTLISGFIMFCFLFLGESILTLLGLDIPSFAVAGAIVIFLIGLEMVLGVHFFKIDSDTNAATIVPLVFPIIAGAGTMTTLISLRAQYELANIVVGIVINLILVFFVLKNLTWIEAKIGKTGSEILRKVFGVILIAIAVKLVKTYFG